LNVRQIEAFRLVMLRGSMTAAAEELGTSQPGVSRLIAELEAITGFKLFTRNGGRLQVTEEGTAFYRDVERSFVGLEVLAQSAREIRSLASGRLRIVAAPLLALYVLPAVIEQFVATRPHLFVSLEMRSEVTMQRWVSSGYCDIGYLTGSPEGYPVLTEELFRLRGLCALPARHPLARRKKIHAEDLRGERLVLPSFADESRVPIDRVLRQAGAGQVPAIETPYAALITSFVSRGLGIGLTNPLSALDEPSERIVFRPFEPQVIYRGFSVVPRLPTPNPIVQEFMELTKACLRDNIAEVERRFR
jgi:DNA-binding transcriptional LysR family regulator